jgi:hypothetical protein
MTDRRRRRVWAPGLVTLVLLLLIYSGTLQRDINGSGDKYMIDVGETQVALNVWGTLHATGYPLFTLLSGALTHAMRVVGLSPAAAASAASTIWSLAALAGAYRLFVRLTDGAGLWAAGTVGVLGLVETIWIHSVVAEVYSFSLLLVSLLLLLGVELAERWDEGRWALAMVLLGVGVQHHRLLVCLVPVLLWMTAPQLWRRRARWPALAWRSLFLFALPFLAYLYLPLRAWQGAPWVAGRPGTWVGFWDQFLGRTLTPGRVHPPSSVTAWVSNLRLLGRALQRQLPWPLWVAGVAGWVWFTGRRAFWVGSAMLAGTFAFMGFVVVFPRAVWIPAVLMPSVLLALGGVALAGSRLTRRDSVGRGLALVLCLALGAGLFRGNLPFVHALVTDPRGREVIETLRPLRDTPLPGERDVVALPWGGTYFAAGYGLYVTERLDGFELVDHRVDFRAVVERDRKILTLAYNLGNWSLDWWTERLGEVHLNTAAPRVAMVSREVLYAGVPPDVDFDLGNGVRVRDVELTRRAENELQVTVYWEATAPVSEAYHVAVHLVDRMPPAGPEDILAQQDALNPVGGWYPTRLWSAGEVVRDDYALQVPPGRTPAGVRIGMYRVAEDGKFLNTEWLSLPLTGAVDMPAADRGAGEVLHQKVSQSSVSIYHTQRVIRRH